MVDGNYLAWPCYKKDLVGPLDLSFGDVIHLSENTSSVLGWLDVSYAYWYDTQE